MYGRVFSLKPKVDGGRVRHVVVDESVQRYWNVKVPAIMSSYRAS